MRYLIDFGMPRHRGFIGFQRKGGGRMANQGYAGKIGNSGSQKVDAPFAPKKPVSGKVHKGDLRDK